MGRAKLAGQPEATLVFHDAANVFRRFSLNLTRQVIGRRKPAGILIDNEFVSGSHAEILFTKNGYSIRDLGSKNGTFLGGQIVGDRPVALRHGATIELGRSVVVLTFQLSDATTTQTSNHLGLDIRPTGSLWLEIRPEAHSVLVDGKAIETTLSPKAFALLSLLFERAGTACSWADISATVWPERGGAPVSPGEVAQQVRQIRQRINPDGNRPDPISSVQGFGYRLDLDINHH